jgi:hypothetical protein
MVGRMRTFPAEFAELLTPRGRRILGGRDAAVREAREVPGQRFFWLPDVIDRRKARAGLALLERALPGTLSRMEMPIPPESILHMTENYAELLPKTVRVQTALLGSRRSRSWRAAEEVGLTAMLRSESFGAFAAAVCGRPLRRRWGIQVLAYGPGDYSGPHTDHHPEDAEAADGYLDMHISLATPAVAHQWLVYARGGHFSHLQGVHSLGGVTAYRLPFWHYTTPLVARPGQEDRARRWVLLGTFLYAPPTAGPKGRIRPPEAAPSRAPAWPSCRGRDAWSR